MTKLNVVCADIAFYGSIVKSFPEDDVKVWNGNKQPCDLLVLTGGIDINPGLYGERNSYSDYSDQRRDRKEMLAWDGAYRNDIPILGICRGFQLGCVLLGGALLQDLYAEAGIFHKGEHELFFDKPGNLEIFTDFPIVNSMHHQGFAPGKRDTNINILAYHQGIPEIVEYKDKFFGVQFHPEFMDRNYETVKFFNSIRSWAMRKKHDAFLLKEGDCFLYNYYQYPFVYGGMEKKSPLIESAADFFARHNTRTNIDAAINNFEWVDLSSVTSEEYEEDENE